MVSNFFYCSSKNDKVNKIESKIADSIFNENDTTGILKQKETVVNSIPEINDSCNFSKDFSVNNLKLRNPSSIVETVGDLSKYLQFHDNGPPDVYLRSKRNEYLKLVIWYGDGKNSFSMFEVGHLKDSSQIQVYNQFEFDSISTESDIKLGLKQSELVQIKGYCYESESSSDYVALTYTEELYIMKYFFNKNDELTKFQFGYLYP
jgi:hypothetical protein